MQINVETRSLGDVVVVVPEIFQDERGFFTETFRADQFKALGCRLSLYKTTIRDLRREWSAGCIFNGNLLWAS
jgi:dTDP-4-dehydrorhamnose 3,5-epimerase-like enzyme